MSMKFSIHAQYFHKYLVTKIEVVITLRHHSLIFLWKRNFSAFIEYKWAAVKFTLFGTCMISYIFFFRVSFCIFDEIAVLDMNKEKMNCIFIWTSNQWILIFKLYLFIWQTNQFVGSYLLSNENGLAKYYLLFLHE